AGFRRAQVAEEELLERTVEPSIDGENGVAGAEAGRFAGIEDLGDDVRPGVVHRPPTEVGAVAPRDDVGSVQAVHRRGRRAGEPGGNPATNRSRPLPSITRSTRPFGLMNPDTPVVAARTMATRFSTALKTFIARVW